MPHIFGYARIDPNAPNDEEQRHRQYLVAAGCDPAKLIIERVALGSRDREIGKIIASLRAGSTLILPYLWHLAKSIRELSITLDGMSNIKVKVKTRLDYDGDLVELNDNFSQHVHVMARFERELLRIRQQEGIEKAKAEGKYPGRKPTARAKKTEITEMRKDGISVEVIARRLNISSSSVYGILRKKEPKSSLLEKDSHNPPSISHHGSVSKRKAFLAVSHNEKARNGVSASATGVYAWCWEGEEEVHVGRVTTRNSEAIRAAAVPEIVSDHIAMTPSEVGNASITIVTESPSFSTYLNEGIFKWLADKTMNQRADSDKWTTALSAFHLEENSVALPANEIEKQILDRLKLIARKAATSDK